MRAYTVQHQRMGEVALVTRTKAEDLFRREYTLRIDENDRWSVRRKKARLFGLSRLLASASRKRTEDARLVCHRQVRPTVMALEMS